LTDDLLLTTSERFGRFGRNLVLASSPTLVVALIVLATGGGFIAGVVAGAGIFMALSIATTVRTTRGAFWAGLTVAIALVVFQIMLAWFLSHPILPGN
jgi:hypothetical protein